MVSHKDWIYFQVLFCDNTNPNSVEQDNIFKIQTREW